MSGNGPGKARPPQVDPAQAERLHRFAHDLKNRLGGLAASLRMVVELEAGPERDEVLAYAEKAYFKALFDLESVLDDLGVDRSPVPGDAVAVSTAELVARVLDELAFRFERKEQRVEQAIGADHVLRGDPDLLHQVVTTLLSNASKFSPPGASIQVRADADGLHVSDPGAGLAPEDLVLVFRPYAWLSSRSSAGEEQGRSSLGRAQRAAQALGGTLEASSPGPGLGSTFTFRLPAPAKGPGEH